LRVTTIALATFAFLFAGMRSAAAGNMDPAPERLVLQPPGLPPGETCQTIAANPEAAVAAGALPNQFGCRPDNVAFRNLVGELGVAIAPSALRPANTEGYGGFTLSFEATFTTLDARGTSIAENGARTRYWELGTEGRRDPNTRRAPDRNTSPDSLIGVYTFKVRKGLPFGFELTGAGGFLGNTSLGLIGGDVRWSLLEGFRTGALGYLPDVSIGSGVRTLVGSPKLYVTTLGLDAQISKPITLASTARLTPFLGYQRLIVFGDSAIVDATPGVDALAQCGYRGVRDDGSGQPDCENRLSNGAPNNGDINNNITFDAVRVHRHRGLVGLTYRYEVIHLGGAFAMDLTRPDAENPGLSRQRQFAFSLEAGVAF
jgi:hypothetical protein